MNVSVCSELLLLPLLALNSITTLSAPWKSHSPFLVFRGQYSYGTISYQESSWFELLYIDLSLLLPWKTTFLSCAFGIAVPFTRSPFPLETLWLTLSESCLNSSVSLILDFCHLLIFPQTSKKKAQPQCSVTPWLWIVYENHEIALHGEWIDFCDPYSRAPTTVRRHQAQDFWNRKGPVREQEKNSSQIPRCVFT